MLGTPRHLIATAAVCSALAAAAGAQCYQQNLARVLLDLTEGVDPMPVVFDGQTAVIPPIAGTAVNVVEQIAGEWSLVQLLSGSDNTTSGTFGQSMALDGGWLVVGTPQHRNNDLRQSGAAYVFQRGGGQWSEVTKLVPADPAEEAFFAEFVAIDGDRAVVSARLGSTGDEQRVYVFEYDGSDWLQTAILISPNQATYDGFGRGLAVWGDTIVVVADSDDDLATDAGALYVFELIAGEWMPTDKVYPPGTLGLGDAALARGFGTGAFVVCPGFPSEYVTYVFEYDGSDWTTTELPHPDPGDGAVWGNPSADGDTIMIAGSSLFLSGISTARYERVGGVWSLTDIYDDLHVHAFDGEIAVSADWENFRGDRALVWDLCAPLCTADWDGDGWIDTLDFLAYLNSWNADDPAADLNGDGTLNTQDFTVFLNLWNAGC